MLKRILVVLLSLSLFTSAMAIELEETSLRGSQVDGGFTVRAGAFYADRNALDLFDYFMTLNGEVAFEQIDGLVRDAIDARLDVRNAKAAYAFWQTYLGYLDQIHTVERLASKDQATYVWDMAQQLNDVAELRNRHFGEEVAARLFADDEAIDALKLARLQAKESGKRIDPFWRDQVESLEADQPQVNKVAFERATLPARIRAFTAALREQGLPEAEIQARRAEAFGEGVNARLSKLEARRAAWNARVESLVQELENQALKRNLSPVARQELVESLVSERFESEPEQLRVRAQLRMRGQL